MGYVKRREIEALEPKEEPPMGHMKDLLITVYGGGDEAVAAAEKLAGLGQWISVLKELPPTDEPVLACWVPREDGMACAMIRNLDGEYCWTPADQWTKVDAPTHWMPLPEPPAS